MAHRVGHYVIMPSYTFVASASAAVWAGYTPILVDVSPESWQMDALRLREALETYGETVAAVLGCSTFGAAASQGESDMWEEACASFGVPLIIDSAAGFGAETEDGSRIGGRGSAEVFSFHATKPFAVGEGGVVICRDPALVDTVRRLVNFGFDEDHDVSVPGLNAKMSEIHAATALAVLDGYDDVLAARREQAGQMSSELVNRGFTVQRGCEGSTFQFVPVLAPSAARRDEILRIAPEARIEVRSYFDVPLHKLSAFRQAECGKLTVTEELAARTLSLPMANDLSEQDIGRILDLCDKATC